MIGKNFLKLNLIFIFLNFGQTFRKCNIQNSHKEDEIVSKIAKHMCYFCTKPICDFESKDCVKISQSLKLPMYNNLLQHGLILEGKYPQSIGLNIFLSQSCILRMEVEKREGEGNSYIFKLKECSETSEKSDCEVILKLFFKKTQFIYYTLKIYKNSTGLAAFHTSSNKIGFKTRLTKTRFFPITCKGIAEDETYVIQYNIQHLDANEEEEMIDGVPVIVPCSEGGMFIDPKTSKLAKGDYLKTLSKDGDNLLISKILDINPDDDFPVKKSATNELLPGYIEDNQDLIPLKKCV
ncbi:UNVERIFIED_CONTAM: hypothetical protein RMT77_018642 [Armadillidium vulgare]